jgi:hypothetical protein
MANRETASFDPAASSLIHGVILHRPAVTGNWDLATKGHKGGRKPTKEDAAPEQLFVRFSWLWFSFPRISAKGRRFSRAAPGADR